jgi:hypothetical protein
MTANAPTPQPIHREGPIALPYVALLFPLARAIAGGWKE